VPNVVGIEGLYIGRDLALYSVFPTLYARYQQLTHLYVFLSVKPLKQSHSRPILYKHGSMVYIT
jgi:hypothetical protein